MPALPTANSAGSASLAPLPTVIQGLVRKRREVKTQMKSCRRVTAHAKCLVGCQVSVGVPSE
jgi:hypothetical protein